jgi:hypothetical protein
VLAVTQQPILAAVAAVAAVNQLVAQVDLESLFSGTPTHHQFHFRLMQLAQLSAHLLVTQSLKLAVR